MNKLKKNKRSASTSPLLNEENSTMLKSNKEEDPLKDIPGMYVKCRICQTKIQLDHMDDHACTNDLLTTSPRAIAAAKSTSVLAGQYLDSPTRQRSTSESKQKKTSVNSSFSTIEVRKPDIVESVIPNDNLFQSSVDTVRITSGGFATYTISTITKSGETYTTERRYREFHAFAKKLLYIAPQLNKHWEIFPPKTYCVLKKNTLQTAFLKRRMASLGTFLNLALTSLMDKHEDKKNRSIVSQSQALQQFLDIPSALDTRTAVQELRGLAKSQLSDWSFIQEYTEKGEPRPDRLYEKYSDGSLILKRVQHLSLFSAQQVFDTIMTPFSDVEVTSVLTPWITQSKIISQVTEQTCVEHLLHTVTWPMPDRELVNLKSWRVETDGTMVIVMVPANAADWPKQRYPGGERADCILGGWVIVPDGKSSCTVSWLMSTHFHGSIGSDSWIAKSFLMLQADHLSNVVHVLKLAKYMFKDHSNIV